MQLPDHLERLINDQSLDDLDLPDIQLLKKRLTDKSANSVPFNKAAASKYSKNLMLNMKELFKRGMRSNSQETSLPKVNIAGID